MGLPLLLSASFGVIFANWGDLVSRLNNELFWDDSLLLTLFLGSLWIGSTLPRPLRSCKATAALAFAFFVFALGISSPFWMKNPRFIWIALPLPLGIIGGVLLEGEMISHCIVSFLCGWILSQALGLPVIGVLGCGAIAAGSGVAAILGISKQRIDPSPKLGQKFSLKPFSRCFFIAALGMTHWQRQTAVIPMPWISSICVASALALAVLVPRERPRIQFPLLTGVSVSFLSAWILPGILKPNLYPFGTGLSQLIGIFVVSAASIVPWATLLFQGVRPERLGKDSILGALLGILIATLGSSFLGFSWMHSCVGLLALLGTARVPNRPRTLILITLAGFFLALGYTESDRYFAPPEEQIVEKRLEKGNSFAVTRSNTDGDLRLRKNYHQLIENIGSFKHLRRHTLLPLAIDRSSRKILVVGGGNAIGVSAAMERPLLEITVLENNSALFDLSRWFTSEEASKNSMPPLTRVIGRPFSLAQNEGKFYDAIIIENVPPWAEGANGLYSVDFLRTAQSRLYPSGSVTQWITLYQWTPELLAKVVANWREVFGNGFQVWRSDLMPEIPLIALISTPPNEPAQKSNPENLAYAPIHDSFLSTPTRLFSLWLGAAESLVRELPSLAAEPFRLDRPQLELLSSLSRFHSQDLIKPDFVLRFLAHLSPEDGPAYGGLLWTRAVQKRRRGEETWKEDQAQAIRYLGFEPTQEYPNAN